MDVARIPIGRYHRAKCWIGLWMYPRFIERRIREALADTPAVILNGPRQSGKTTLARRLAGPDWTYLTLDDATLLNAARSDPVGFVRGLDRAVIDEVQLAPDLLPAVKRSIDEDRRPGRFLLTGSANILTIPRVKESLAGRMEILPLYPLSRGEVLGSKPPRFLASAFAGRAPPPPHETLVGEDLVATVLAGGYPEVLARSSERRRRDWCRSYVDAIVERTGYPTPSCNAAIRLPAQPRSHSNFSETEASSLRRHRHDTAILRPPPRSVAPRRNVSPERLAKMPSLTGSAHGSLPACGGRRFTHPETGQPGASARFEKGTLMWSLCKKRTRGY